MEGVTSLGGLRRSGTQRGSLWDESPGGRREEGKSPGPIPVAPSPGDGRAEPVLPRPAVPGVRVQSPPVKAVQLAPTEPG